MKRCKVGKLKANGVKLEPHEHATVSILLTNGENIELVKKSHTPHTKSPDIVMLGMLWEMKSPKGKSIRCAERALRRATHQAQNVVIDLRRIKITDKSLVTLLEQLFHKLRSIRHLWIITKTNELIKLKK